MVRGVVRQTKVAQMYIPVAMVAIQESHDHDFQNSIDSFHGICLWVIRRDRSVRNTVLLRKSSQGLINKLRTVVRQKKSRRAPTR